MMSEDAGSELAVYRRLGIEIVAGCGAVVLTADGRELIDFYGGHAVAILGQGHPGLVRRLRDQAERLFFQTNLVDVAVRQQACDALAAFAPSGLDRVFLVSTGAEANENALRLALRFVERRRVVALEGGFHGRSAAAAACTDGSEKWYGFPQRPFEVTFIPVDDHQALEAALDEDVAALILEPIQGMAGARDLAPEFLVAARRRCTEVGARLIADEVQCGMGRSGRRFAFESAGILPDILTTAKGLAGGFPAGALWVTEEIAERVGIGDLGTTFGGGPMASALILEVLGAITAPGFLDTVREREARIRECCRVGPVTDIQGRGLLLGLRCARPAAEILGALLERGLLAGASRDPQVIRLMPPLTIESAHVDALAAALRDIGS